MQTETTPKDHEVITPASSKKEVRFHTLKRFWRSDKLMSLFALLISMGTFITFAYQNYLIQKQQYRSVMPYLIFSRSNDHNPKYTVSLRLLNNGIGPAFVEKLSIRYNGKEYHTIEDFLLEGIYAETPIRSSRTEIRGYVLPANQYVSILTSNDSTSAQVLDKVFDEIQIEITYSSLYDEQWKVDLSNSKPIPID